MAVQQAGSRELERAQVVAHAGGHLVAAQAGDVHVRVCLPGLHLALVEALAAGIQRHGTLPVAVVHRGFGQAEVEELEVDEVVARGIHTVQALAQRDPGPGRVADLVGVHVQVPVVAQAARQVFLHLQERVEHHRPGLVEIELERVVSRILAAIGIVAIDLDAPRSFRAVRRADRLPAIPNREYPGSGQGQLGRCLFHILQIRDFLFVLDEVF